MPAPAVRVDLTARDLASSALERLNKRLEQLQAPAQRSQKALDRFRDVSGLDRLGEGLGRVRNSASSAFRSLGEIVPVLGTITGAASLAGIYRLSTSWANFGSRLGFAAQRIGVSSTQLMSLGGAARIAGSSADALQSGMQTLGQGMWDAVGGRNPELMAAFQTLHIGFQNADGSAKSVAQVLPQVADRIAAIRNPFAQAAVAAAFFGGAAEDLLPFLRLGSKGMAEYQREAVGYGAINAKGVAAANRLRMAQTRLSLAVEGFGYSVAEKLEPVLSPVIQGMAAWISQNKGWIATDIAGYVKRFSDWVKGIDWASVKADASNAWAEFKAGVNWLGGWKTAGEVALGAIAALYAAPVLAGIAVLGRALSLALSPLGLAAAGVSFAASRGGGKIPEAAWGTLMAQTRLNKLDQGVRENVERHQASLRPEQFSAMARESIADFMRMGWSRAQSDIIVGNLAQESGLNPYKINPKSGAFGMAQWMGSRVADFRAIEGIDLPNSTPGQQRDFVSWELRHKERGAGGLLGKLTDESQAAFFGRAYERYGVGEEGNRTRYAMGFAGLDVPAPKAPGLLGRGSLIVGGPEQALAADIAERQSQQASSRTPMPSASGPPISVPAGSAQGNAFQGVLDQLRLAVDVTHKNAPAGSSVRVRTEDPRVRVQKVETQRAMDPDIAAKGY